MAKINPMLILAVLILATILIGSFMLPSMLRAGVDFLDDLSDIYRSFLDQPPENGNGNGNGEASSSGYTAITLEIYYSDGSSKEFKAPPYSIIPLTIIDFEGDYPVEYIKAYVDVAITWEGTLMSWSSSHTFVAEVQGVTVKSETKSYSGGQDWEQGVERRIYEISIYHTLIDDMLATDGEYDLDITEVTNLTVDFAGGISDTKTSEASAVWHFRYEALKAGLTSLQVTVSTFAFRFQH